MKKICKWCDGFLGDVGSIQCGAIHQEYQDKNITIKEKARTEYHQLRNDDGAFADQWDDDERDFEEWFEDVYLKNN